MLTIEALVLALVAAAVFAAYMALRPTALVAIDNSGSAFGNRPTPAKVRSAAGLRFHQVTVVVFNHDGVTEVHGSKLPPAFGGTDFTVLARWVAEHDAGFDRVVVATDGYASEVNPAAPQRWTWLLTEQHTPTWLEDSASQVRHLVAA